MDKRMTRFKHCDSRLYPYLDKVLARLPEQVREELLNTLMIRLFPCIRAA